MSIPGTVILIGLAASLTAAAQSVPPELTALAAKAHLDRPVAAWCRGEFQSGRPGAFAVAVTSVTSAAGGGRYLVLEPDATMVELAAFTRGPDLACYSPVDAARLGAAITRSETIQGHLTPRWTTTVVCAFTDDTSAVCWQYSPADRAFVKVGEWVT